jgi:hypothetical protein
MNCICTWCDYNEKELFHYNNKIEEKEIRESFIIEIAEKKE